jgi:sugar O-acyltransferase (sialic acid O-acetyltransferase NeuD family)
MSNSLQIVVVGAGGQARDTAWLIEELARAGAPYRFRGFVLSDLKFLSPRDSKERLLGDFAWLEQHASEVDALALGIGTPQVRLALAERLTRDWPRLEWPQLVHPSVHLDHASAQLGRGTMIACGTAGTVNFKLDDFALVNVGCTLGHEASIGRGSVVNHGASISGGVVLGEGVLVGTGARVLQYLEVGAGATIGAGAVVTKNVLPGAVMVGVPARPLTRSGRPVEEQP